MTEAESRQIERHNEFIAKELAVRDFRASIAMLRENDYAKLLNLAHELAHNLGYELVKPYDTDNSVR